MFDFDFGEDYLIIGGIIVALILAGAYYFYFRHRSEKKVDFNEVDASMHHEDDQSVSSKDEYVCEGDMCMKR